MFPALRPVLSWIRRTSEPAARPTVHLSTSVRPATQGIPAAWAWSTSENAAGTGSLHEETSAIVLEAAALLDAVRYLPDRNVVVHALTDPIAKLGTLNSFQTLARYQSQSRTREVFDDLTAHLAQLESVRFVAPGSACSCDKAKTKTVSRSILRRHHPMPSQIPAQRTPVEDTVVVATDGSYDHIAKVGGWAWHVSEETWAAGTLVNLSSSALELEAVIAALSSLSSSPIEVVSDCQVVVRGINILAAGGEIRTGAADQDQWRRLQVLMDDREVYASWVRAHQGHASNTFVDIAARAAMRSVVRATQRKKNELSLHSAEHNNSEHGRVDHGSAVWLKSA